MANFNSTPSSTGSNDLIHMLSTILVRRLKVVQLLLEVGDVVAQLSRVARQSLCEICLGTKDEPVSINE